MEWGILFPGWIKLYLLYYPNLMPEGEIYAGCAMADIL